MRLQKTCDAKLQLSIAKSVNLVPQNTKSMTKEIYQKQSLLSIFKGDFLK